MRTLIALLLMVGGCSTPTTHRTPPDSPVVRHYVGHWSVGPAYSWFTPVGSSVPYSVEVSELPVAVREQLYSQPKHQTYSDGPEASVYLEIEGRISPASEASGFKVMHIQKVISSSEPKRNFLANRNYPPSKE
jgi:hypothetical protein